MAKERDPAQSGSFKLTESSGSHELRRKRLSGVFDAGSAARCLELIQGKNLHGTIVVSDGLSDLSFLFTRGGLRVLSLGRPLPSLAARLVATGKLDPKLAPKARSGERDKGSREERDILIEVMNLPPAVVDEAARDVLADVFLDCLFWEDPQFEATTGEPDPEVLQRRDVPALTLSLGVKDMIAQVLARMRTATDLRRNVSSMQVVVEPLGKGREAAGQGGRIGDGPLAANRTRLLKKIVAEPGRRAGDLVKSLGLGELEIATHVHELAAQGYVKLDRQPRDKAEELARLRAMEEQLDQALSQLVRRVRVAHEATHAGDAARAGKHMARAGGLLLSEGRDEEAVKTLQSALQLAPENLEGREGYVQSLWATNRVVEAVGQSEELGKRYLDLNLPARARRVLERAVSREEKTSSLELLVKSLVKLRQPKAAAEAGERLVNRMRREGRGDEARQVAADLFELATDADKQKLLRAAGADRRAVAGLMVLALLLVAAFFPASQALAARNDYDGAAREVGLALKTERDLGQLRRSLAGARDRFAALEAHGGEVAERAQAVTAAITLVDEDAAKLERLRELFPWQQSPDLEQALKQLKAVRPDTVALTVPLERLVADVQSFRQRAEQVREQLLRWDPSPEGFALARKAREEFKGLPAILSRMVVRVRLTSDPAEAQVRWDGVDYSQTTPLVIGVPLQGDKRLLLSREGFEPYERDVGFDALDDRPELFAKLEPARANTPVRTPPPQRPARPPEPTPTAAPDGTPTDPAPRPGGIIVTGPRTPPPPRARHQVEFRDGGWEGAPDARFEFDVDEGYLAFLGDGLAARFRVTVQAVNSLEGTNVHLTGLRVYLEVLGSTGWRRERPHVVALSDRYRRPVIAEGGDRYRVQLVARCLHMDESWLKSRAREAVDEAVRQAIIRERDSRRGR